MSAVKSRNDCTVISNKNLEWADLNIPQLQLTALEYENMYVICMYWEKKRTDSGSYQLNLDRHVLLLAQVFINGFTIGQEKFALIIEVNNNKTKTN